MERSVFLVAQGAQFKNLALTADKAPHTGLGENSVHITDTAEEVVAIAELVLSQNSLRRLNSVGWPRSKERR